MTIYWTPTFFHPLWNKLDIIDWIFTTTLHGRYFLPVLQISEQHKLVLMVTESPGQDLNQSDPEVFWYPLSHNVRYYCAGNTSKHFTCNFHKHPVLKMRASGTQRQYDLPKMTQLASTEVASLYTLVSSNSNLLNLPVIHLPSSPFLLTSALHSG